MLVPVLASCSQPANESAPPVVAETADISEAALFAQLTAPDRTVMIQVLAQQQQFVADDHRAPNLAVRLGNGSRVQPMQLVRDHRSLPCISAAFPIERFRAPGPVQ